MRQRCSPDDRAAVDALVTRHALAAAAGDRPALAEFIRLTQADVWRFCAHLAGRDAADDLTQDTYLRAMDALPRFEGRSSARAWLLAIARHAAADAARRAAARPQVPRPTAWLAAHGEASDPTLAVELEALLATLGADRREAFVLTQVLGFSYAEAAAICDCRIGTIRSRVARARLHLVALWGEPDADGVRRAG